MLSLTWPKFEDNEDQSIPMQLRYISESPLEFVKDTASYTPALHTMILNLSLLDDYDTEVWRIVRSEGSIEVTGPSWDSATVLNDEGMGGLDWWKCKSSTLYI